MPTPDDTTVEEDVFDFALADRAFAMFTLPEKRRALEVMATLQYASVTDRFFEGVCQVIGEQRVRELRANNDHEA